jgi:hypothetical protein
MSLKQTKTIPGLSRGSVIEILSYHRKKDSYKVSFEVKDDEDYIDTISAKELRVNKPLKMSQLDLEYFENQK